MSHQKTRILTLALLLAAMTFSLAEDYWQQDVTYRMEVFLDPETHQLSGSSHIIYTNNSPDALDVFYMILYPNAYRVGSVMHREASVFYRDAGISADNPSGIEVQTFTLSMPGGETTTEFRVDDTILEVQLPTALEPGQSMELELEWVHTVRRHTRRAGYRGKQYDFAQWYPKVVVYDQNGWNNEPFHMMGEFYGEFSTFDVTMDVPYSYIIGATGTVTEGDPGWEEVRVDTSLPWDEWLEQFKTDRKATLEGKLDDRRVVSFHAEQVHDFAWITSPTFVYESGQWGGTQVHVLFNQRVGSRWTGKVVARTERAVEWLTGQFGPYPYPQVTNTHGMLGGGMEYPMLVMDGSEREGLIVHEVGHIWFYGILGNNEMTEAWLDEGFTSYQTRKYMIDRYGEIGIDPASRSNDNPRTPALASAQWSTARYQTSGYNQPIGTASYRATAFWNYSQNAYTKPSLMLHQLEYILGQETFSRGMQAYYDQWKLKHTNEARYRQVMETASGQELDWFFDQWLHTDGYFDVALENWTQTSTGGSYEISVDLALKGPWEMPVVVEAVTASGATVRTTWTDFQHRRTGTVTLSSPERVTGIVLDPDDRLGDVDRRNNRSGMLTHEFGSTRRMSRYTPRDAYVVTYAPGIRYNFRDQLTPVIGLRRSYGRNLSNTGLEIAVGAGSGKVDYRLTHERPLIMRDTRARLAFESFDRDGVSLTTLRVSGEWSKRAFTRPVYHASFGITGYAVYDPSYAPGLFEKGNALIAKTELGVRRQTMIWTYEYSVTAEGAPAKLADTPFTRFNLNFSAARDIGAWHFSSRVLMGGIWSSQTVPLQELYTINGAGSLDTHSKPYLGAKGGLYGLEDIAGNYHLPGDGNLRGFYDGGFRGVEQIMAATLELERRLTRFNGVDLRLRLFADGGLVWGDRLNAGDAGFDGNLLADAGPGLRISRRLFGRTHHLRIDLPVLRLSNDSGSMVTDIDFSRWLFSFQAGF